MSELFEMPTIDAEQYRALQHYLEDSKKQKVCKHGHIGQYKRVIVDNKFTFRCAECRRVDARSNTARENARKKKYRLAAVNAIHPDFDKDIVVKYYERSLELSENTGIKYHVDHIIPIDRGGIHHQDSIQIISEQLNCSKGNTINPYIKGERLLNGDWSDDWDMDKQIILIKDLMYSMNRELHD